MRDTLAYLDQVQRELREVYSRLTLELNKLVRKHIPDVELVYDPEAQVDVIFVVPKGDRFPKEKSLSAFLRRHLPSVRFHEICRSLPEEAEAKLQKDLHAWLSRS